MDTNILKQIPAPIVPAPIPEHAPHTVLDAADEVLKKRKELADKTAHEKEERRLKGFATVHLCPTCKKRVHPREVNGVQMPGACPYCKSVGMTQPETFYTGVDARPANRYARPDDRAFEQGMKSGQLTTLFKRANPVQGTVSVQQ